MKSIPHNPKMTVHQSYPLNAGPLPEVLDRRFVTPAELFFVRTHGSIPSVDTRQYRLAVSGFVRQPLQLSLDELRSNFPVLSLTATLQCAGNRRNELASVQPIPGELPWQFEAIGNTIWCGVPLHSVLEAADVLPCAKHVAFTGLDEIHKDGRLLHFGGSIPLEKAMSLEVLLAYEMDNEPLSPAHGFPLRVVVPGYVGARSVKWLSSITVQDTPSSNYYQSQAYKLFPPSVRADTVDWADGQMLGELPINAVICHPQDGEELQAGSTLVHGYAIVGGGYKVEQVDISSDGGATWTRAQMVNNPSSWTWCFWEARLDLRPGFHHLVVRAWDSLGRYQPEDLHQVWNFKGYLNNAWHRIGVHVQARRKR